MPVWKRVSRSLRNLLKSSQTEEVKRKVTVFSGLFLPWTSKISLGECGAGGLAGGWGGAVILGKGFHMHAYTTHTHTHTHTHTRHGCRKAGSCRNGTESQGSSRPGPLMVNGGIWKTHWISCWKSLGKEFRFDVLLSLPLVAALLDNVFVL